MKARTKTTRWLLIALLFGLLAATGLTLANHHRGRGIANANDAAGPTHAVLQRPTPALVASGGGKYLLTTPAGERPHRIADSTYSNRLTPETTGPSDPRLNTSTADVGGLSNASHPAGDSIAPMRPQGDRPASSVNSHQSQAGTGDFAYDGYAPLDCELPAGCGVGATGYVSRPISGSSGGMPSVHNSQGSNSGGDDSVPQPNDGSPQSNVTGPLSNLPGQSSDPPGSNTMVAAAPELDPATLAGAITLLLGSLAVLRGRRARARC